MTKLDTRSKLATLAVGASLVGAAIGLSKNAAQTEAQLSHGEPNVRLVGDSSGQPEEGRTYLIQQNDTLSQIASSQLGGSTLWPLLAEKNNVEPESLQVGMALSLPDQTQIDGIPTSGRFRSQLSSVQDHGERYALWHRSKTLR